MKKLIFNLIVILILPVVITFFATLVSSKLQFGMESVSVQEHLMGKAVLVETKGLYKNVDVEEYVLGAMAEVIPPDYDLEALKVQAVLIRTNILKEMEEQNTANSEDLSYQYLSAEEREALWGKQNYRRNESRFEQAVSATSGQVIYYKNELIMALYHEVSIGKTANGKEVLGEEVPYLQSVESSQDVEAKNYMNMIIVTKEQYMEIMELEDKDKEMDICIEESSENGFVQKLRVGNDIYTGKEAMELFALPSMNFYVEKVEEGNRFVCLGKGDCLGVSMYGANYMAQQNSTYEEIISYYYKDIHIEKYN